MRLVMATVVTREGIESEPVSIAAEDNYFCFTLDDGTELYFDAAALVDALASEDVAAAIKSEAA